ncbi:MAG: ankyrin repeat domain-containing protein [Bacteroidota bacterium]
MKKILLFILFTSASLHLLAQSIFRTACQGNLARLDSMLVDTDINTKDQRERSLLHWAVACDKKEVFDYLITKGIAINAGDDQRKTPMHMALRFDSEAYLDQLYALQPNEDWMADYGASLLEMAVLKKSKAFVKKLISYGVNINSTNDRGSTALEIAQRMNDKEMADFLLSIGADPTLVRKIEMSGPYMGQPEPGIVPQVFAPNYISTEEYEFGSVFNVDGTEFYYGVDIGNNSEIRYSERIEGKWTKPVVILSHDVYGYNDPFLSPDEQRLYFISKRALDGVGPQKEDHDIWYVERQKEGWSAPINAGPNINSEANEYYISFTQDGTMYFSSNVNAPEDRKRSDLDIYYSKYRDGEFQKAVSLGDSINTEHYEADVFVDPKEQYLIFCSTRPDGLGRGDLYISFKKPDGNWTKAINMGEPVNTQHHELCPFVSPDGKFLFYTSDEDIYWVSMKVIDQLKHKANP